ncbi:sulfur carrier protein [Clostridium cavendishii DSM 21758]|uniref:Sulfur carrier protein n=1 Tax=Clostridium cavendishii DSM 21758 TaxID=1121302 RepID=A0A1M6I6S3_9CLOT|nr:sulfur carrier protein ThiS [Clostridium cavendishii]SHJ30135.1 sulfur carrier protein [Clostridium cavendishii DSM 21758]
MRLNGKNIELEKETTIEELLEQYNINSSRVVVEVNREIVEKTCFSSVKLKNEDTIEVISFVGGG